jgi:hypothetical protein
LAAAAAAHTKRVSGVAAAPNQAAGNCCASWALETKQPAATCQQSWLNMFSLLLLSLLLLQIRLLRLLGTGDKATFFCAANNKLSNMPPMLLLLLQISLLKLLRLLGMGDNASLYCC